MKASGAFSRPSRDVLAIAQVCIPQPESDLANQVAGLEIEHDEHTDSGRAHPAGRPRSVP